MACRCIRLESAHRGLNIEEIVRCAGVIVVKDFMREDLLLGAFGGKLGIVGSSSR